MSTQPRFTRYLIPVLMLTAAQLLSPVMPAASRRPLTKSASAKTLSAKNTITISLSHRIREGSLVVTLDGTPIFSEGFTKPIYLISQTTTWDPVEAAVGKHMLAARVQGKNGKAYLSGTYELQLSRSKGIELLIRMKGDKLTIDQAS